MCENPEEKAGLVFKKCDGCDDCDCKPEKVSKVPETKDYQPAEGDEEGVTPS